MKFHDYTETDSLYIDLVDRPSEETHEVAPGVLLDFDAQGALVGIDVDRASEVVDIARLEIEELPLASLSMARGA